MAKEITYPGGLISSLSRRRFIQLSAGALAHEVLPFRQNTQTDSEVPLSLQTLYSPDRKEAASIDDPINLSLAAIHDTNEITSAIYSLSTHGEVSSAFLNPTSGNYELSETQKIPFRWFTSLTALKDTTTQQDIVIVGGSDSPNKEYGKNATIAVSKDSGQSFQMLPLIDVSGQAVRSQVKDIKAIPHTKKVLVYLSDNFNYNHQYGIFDTENDEFSFASEVSPILPLHDDLFVNPDDLSTLWVVGRRLDPEVPKPGVGIVSFSINLDHPSSPLIDTEQKLSFVSDVQMSRNPDGSPDKLYALQTIRDEGPQPRERKFLEIDPQGDMSTAASFDYGGLFDSLLLEALKNSPIQVNQEISKHAISQVILDNILIGDGNFWATGTYLSSGYITGRPFVAFWQREKDELMDKNSLRVFPFVDVMISPSSVNQRAEFVRFKNSKQPSLGSTDSIYGVLVDIQAAGQAIIRTTETREPLDVPPLFMRTHPSDHPRKQFPIFLSQ